MTEQALPVRVVESSARSLRIMAAIEEHRRAAFIDGYNAKGSPDLKSITERSGRMVNADDALVAAIADAIETARRSGIDAGCHIGKGHGACYDNR